MSGQDSMDFMSLLPEELLLAVSVHLDYKDLCRLGCVCRRLYSISRRNVLWGRLCALHWREKLPPNEDDKATASSVSGYETFQGLYRRWGPFIGCYSTIKGYWDQIETSLEGMEATGLLESLNGPKTADDSNACIKESLDLPEDLLCSLHIHNGQRSPTDEESATYGLGGLVHAYGHQSCPILQGYGRMRVRHFPHPDSNESDTEREGPATLSVLVCPFSGTTIHIFLESFGDFNRGNMIHCPNDFESDTFFELVRNRGFYLVAESFTDWLRQLAERLEGPGCLFTSSTLYRFYLEPSCVAVTRDIKVSVATAFVPELSEALLKGEKNVFAYYISVEMDAGAPNRNSCQLLTRHWIVTSDDGRTVRVNGDGVIGACPIFRPGTEYSWSSCTSFHASAGSMEGHFGMVNLQTNETFDLKCPKFNMTSLPFVRLPGR